MFAEYISLFYSYLYPDPDPDPDYYLIFYKAPKSTNTSAQRRIRDTLLNISNLEKVRLQFQFENVN